MPYLCFIHPVSYITHAVDLYMYNTTCSLVDLGFSNCTNKFISYLCDYFLHKSKRYGRRSGAGGYYKTKVIAFSAWLYGEPTFNWRRPDSRISIFRGFLPMTLVFNGLRLVAVLRPFRSKIFLTRSTGARARFFSAAKTKITKTNKAHTIYQLVEVAHHVST